MKHELPTRAGFTLYETVVTVAILAVLFGAVGIAVLSGERAFEASRTQDALQTRARRTLDRIADVVSMAMRGEIVPPIPAAGSSEITVHAPVGVAGDLPIAGDDTRVELQADPEDPDDDVDNDRDGLVDECRIVLVEHVGLAHETRTVIANGVADRMEGEIANALDDNGNGLVDERGLSFESVAGGIRIRLSLAETDSEGRLVVRTFETNVRPRN